jgi:hypothetical protein
VNVNTTDATTELRRGLGFRIKPIGCKFDGERLVCFVYSSGRSARVVLTDMFLEP